MQLPTVTIGIITYNRPDEIVQTVEALRTNLLYEASALRWIVADDSSPNGYLTRLKKLKLFNDLKAQFITTSENGGWGKNANNLLAHVETDYLLLVEDDKILHREYDLQAAVALMEAKPDIGMVRVKGTQGDHVVFHQFEADISASYPTFQQGVGLVGKLTYLQIDSGSPSLWLYSNGIHLRHKRFTKFYGVYPEGLKLGATEEKYAHQVKDGMKLPGAPAIVTFPEMVIEWTQDIGKSYQLTEADK